MERGSISFLIVAVVIVLFIGGLIGSTLFKNLKPPKSSSQNSQKSLSIKNFDIPPRYFVKKFSIEITFDKTAAQDLTISNAEIRVGYVPHYIQPRGKSYTLKIFDRNNVQKYHLAFVVPNYRFTDNTSQHSVQPGKFELLDKTVFSFDIPYNSSYALAKIIDPNGQITDQKSIGNLSYKNSVTPKAGYKTNWFALLDKFINPRVWAASPQPLNPCTDNVVCLVVLGDRTYWQSRKAVEDEYSQELDYAIQDTIANLFKANSWFNTNKNAFGFTEQYIPNHFQCNFYRPGFDCYPKTLARFLDQRGVKKYDIILVLDKLDGSLLGGAYLDPIPTIMMGGEGPATGATLAHELGHALGRMADEYVYTNPDGSPQLDPTFTPQGQPLTPNQLNFVYVNCYAGALPVELWESSVGQLKYQLGCSKANWWRSSQDNVMRYPWDTSNYNPLSEHYMNLMLDSFLRRLSDDYLPPAMGTPVQIPLGEYYNLPSARPTSAPDSTPQPTTNPANPLPTNNPNTNLPSKTCSANLDLQASVIGSTSIQLTWNLQPNTSLYLLRYVTQNTDGTWPPQTAYQDLGTFSQSTNEFIHTNLQAKTTYAYHLAAARSDGTSLTCGPLVVTLP